MASAHGHVGAFGAKLGRCRSVSGANAVTWNCWSKIVENFFGCLRHFFGTTANLGRSGVYQINLQLEQD